MNESKCPFCGQVVSTFGGFSGPVFAWHKNADAEVCSGWGKSVAKANELRAAILDMLKVIEDRYGMKIREDL
jgi:hypothetical protein